MATIITTALRSRREAQGMKQIELAARAGVAVSTVLRAEKWKFKLTPTVAEKLARVLRCKPADITGESE